MGVVTSLQEAGLVSGTLSTSSGTVVLYQPVADILDIGGWQDAVFIISVRDVVLASGDSMSLELITSPLPDAGVGGLGIAVGSPRAITGPSVERIVARSTDTAVQPLERYVFWRLTMTPGGTPGPWRLYFEILASLKRGG